MGNTGAWNQVRRGLSVPGMTPAQLLKSARYTQHRIARSIGQRYGLEFLLPEKGGSNALCPYRCGWKKPLGTRELNRKFRRHQQESCPGVYRLDEEKEYPHWAFPQLKNPPHTVEPSDPKWHRGMDGRLKKVQTVELPA